MLYFGYDDQFFKKGRLKVIMPDVNRGNGALPTPLPDPSVLTTRQLLREVEILYSVIEDTVESSYRAAADLKEFLQVQITNAKEVHGIQFDAQVVLLDERFTTSVKALDAAFAAAKLAVDTAQLAADKAVDRERETSNKRFDALDTKYAELASRLDKNSGGDANASVAENAKRFMLATAVSVISVVAALAAVLVAILR